MCVCVCVRVPPTWRFLSLATPLSLDLLAPPPYLSLSHTTHSHTHTYSENVLDQDSQVLEPRKVYYYFLPRLVRGLSPGGGKVSAQTLRNGSWTQRSLACPSERGRAELVGGDVGVVACRPVPGNLLGSVPALNASGGFRCVCPGRRAR